MHKYIRSMNEDKSECKGGARRYCIIFFLFLLSFDGTIFVTGSGLFIDCVRFATIAGFSPSFSLVLLFVDILRDKC